MLKAVSELLDGSPGLKGRQIAKALGLDKSQVNSFLHKNQDTFVKNSNHEWCLIRAQHVEIDFATGWIDEKAFESAIGKLAYQKDATKVTFKFGIDCKFLLIALARFLALANQLTANGKDVVIDTTACPNARGFFSRNGFFDYLNQSVTCLPERPVLSAAKTYRDNSDTLVELGEIAQPTQNKELVIRLGDRFVEHTSASYFLAAKTVFSELVGNVTDHSEST
ncbi:hypothetical protein [Vibrio cholerae]|uniref:hypothetical protein n=1 Tax=Vibrio cholerae TaxID=666 RepID=UPI0021AFD870|nr:hypothetical protein [Vibrio cholerae]